MSIITTEKDYTQNNNLDAGYFRIGFVSLRIPPEDISTSRAVNNESIQTIRGMNEMFRKTGQAVWNVSISWTALLNSGSDQDRFQQWNDLVNIVAIFKAAPFVEVESPTLRQLLAAYDPAFSSASTRLSMGLQQLRIDTHPDIIDALKVTLTMTYFNAMPYTLSFGYQTDDGSVGEAYKSSKFKEYISKWRVANMTHMSRQQGDPSSPPWYSQSPGELALKWREYLPVMTGQVPEWASRIDAPAQIAGTVIASNVKPSTPKGKTALRDAGVEQIIESTAPKYGLDPAIIKALCFTESSGRINPPATGVSSAKGLFQLTDATAKRFNVADPLDAQQNTNGGCAYMKYLLGRFQSYDVALAAYLCGEGVVQSYMDGKRNKYNPNGEVTGGIPPAGVPAAWANAPAYVAKVLGIAQTSFGYNNSAPFIPPPSSGQGATNTTTPPNSGANPVTFTNPQTEAEFENMLNRLHSSGDLNDPNGWAVDHRADPAGVGVMFLYKEKELRLDPPDVMSGRMQPGLCPMQLSVLFVNNLAQIPMAGYQYPTYQHMGPCSSMVQVSFVSKGDRNTGQTDEPVHQGLMALTSMAHNMEQQYHRLKTQFRSVRSVHRMQAVYVENQILNMLGIWGLMLHNVDTQTMRDSSDMMSAQLNGSQYENKFEVLTSYKVNAIDGVYVQELQKLTLGDGLEKAVSGITDSERASVGAAVDYRRQMQNADETALNGYLLNAAKQLTDSSPFSLINGAQTFTVKPEDAANLYRRFLNKEDAYPVAIARMKQLQQSGRPNTWTIADYLMFKAVAGDGMSMLSGDLTVVSIDHAIASTVKRQDMVRDAYARLFPYFAVNDVPLRNALNNVMQSPILGKSIKDAVAAEDPALANSDHGAYRDMGLSAMTVDGQDFNPGMYFGDTKKRYLKTTHKTITDILQQTVSGSNQLNSTTDGHTPDVQVASAVLPAGQIPIGQIPLDATTSIPGNTDSIMKMINVPGYSMAEAFPTFKLFFMEDANDGVYYAFDNFYSFAAVTDIEVQRPYNRPATMRIKLMNLTHLLNHKLFDGSLAGKWEASLYRWANASGGAQFTDAGPQVGFVGRTGLGGSSYQMGRDNTEGYEGGDMANRRIPLQYFPLQTGTKIQLRVGAANNPDKLTPVFVGEVTEIEGTEVLTITAQSYLLELATVTPDQMQKNTWFHLGALIESPGKLIPGLDTGPGPAFGGVTIFGDSGDVGTVIWNMLKTAQAKHFGHWQVNSASNSLLKGFGWKELLADNAAVTAKNVFGADNVARALQNVYDRSDENIMVDTCIQYDGTVTKVDLSGNSRSWMDQNKYPWVPASYYVSANTQLTVWELIQDISRRRPEYLLLEKWYGFPYSADATLVYGHPFDWYKARPLMLDDTETFRAAAQNTQAYKDWWTHTGWAAFTNMVRDVMGGRIDGTTLLRLQKKAEVSPDGLSAALDDVLQIYTNGVAIDSQNALARRVKEGLSGLTGVSSWILSSYRQNIRQVQHKIDAVQNAYYASILADKQQSTDLLKPVRRYHLIDHQTIVHNGIRLNEKIYNSIRICDPDKNGKGHSIPANANIPAQHIRVLDVTDQINDPKQNVLGQSLGSTGLLMAYVQSFLREEVGKMYRGEIVLRGVPEIEPMDVLMICDPSTGMVGPVEVESVMHKINVEEGFITIVKPRAVVCVNEAASASFLRMLGMTMGTVIPEIHRLGDLSGYSKATVAAGASGVAGTAVAGVAGAAKISSVASAAGDIALEVATAPGASAVTTAVAGAASTGATAVGEGAAATGAFLMGPPGWAILALCVVATAGAGVWWFTNATAKSNPLVICPVTKFGRPWVGGIEGWAINDLVGVVNNKVMQFMADEVFPVLDAWKAFHGYQPQITPTSNNNPGQPFIPPVP